MILSVRSTALPAHSKDHVAAAGAPAAVTECEYRQVVSDTPDQDVRLAEFAALRVEITQRSSFQQALNALNLTVVATIAGLVLSNHAAKSLLLFVPVISSTFGLLWLDHHRNIVLIATYVREELWRWTPSWEVWFAQHRAPIKEIIYFVAVGVVYGGVPPGFASDSDGRTPTLLPGNCC